MNIEVLLDCRATIGESPTWSPSEGSIYWIDVKAPALHRLDARGRRRLGSSESDVGAFALTDGRRAQSSRCEPVCSSWTWQPAQPACSRRAPFDPDLFRFNEGICDRQGRFWIGVMFDPQPGHQARRLPHRCTASPARTAWSRPRHRRAAQRRRLERGRAQLHAGPTPTQGSIYRASYDPHAGTIGPAQPFARVAAAEGLPDGAAMDEEGCYWCAIHGGGVLHRYDPAGRLVGTVDLPVSQPTMCAFVGEALDEMVVTSATGQADARAAAREPLAGACCGCGPACAASRAPAWSAESTRS